MSAKADATVTLPAEIAAVLHSSGAEGRPIVVSYRGADGKEHPSYRGSTHVHAEDQLALWVRNPAGGLPRALERESTLTLIYRNPETDTYYRISGVGHIETAPEVREKVYTDSPPHERAQDPKQAGVALLIDVVRLAGHDGERAVKLGAAQ
jgi:hypothetical protein